MQLSLLPWKGTGTPASVTSYVYSENLHVSREYNNVITVYSFQYHPVSVVLLVKIRVGIINTDKDFTLGLLPMVAETLISKWR